LSLEKCKFELGYAYLHSEDEKGPHAPIVKDGLQQNSDICFSTLEYLPFSREWRWKEELSELTNYAVVAGWNVQTCAQNLTPSQRDELIRLAND
jgi:hypothetical protein